MASTYVKMVLGEDDSILVLGGFDIQSLRVVDQKTVSPLVLFKFWKTASSFNRFEKRADK